MVRIAATAPAPAWILGLSTILALACTDRPPAPSPSQAASSPRNLILLTADTWRGDHFLATAGNVDLTPGLRELAGESIVFRNAYSAANATAPGVAAILTGLLPRRSGVETNDHLLPDSLPTIATLLREQGYDTAAFVANPVLRPGNGFEAGFDTYVVPARQRPRRKARAEQIHHLALEWLEKRTPDRPFFLWLHYMEPHGPYEPPPEAVERFAIEDFEADREIPLQHAGDQSGDGGIPFYQQYGQAEPSRDGRHYLLRYAAEITDLDRSVAGFLAAVDSAEWSGETILAMTADHGEALAGDHGFFFSHGNGVTEDQISVPLLLHVPEREAAVVDKAVSTVDVVPTLLKLLGVPPPTDLDGSDLLGADPLPNLAFAQAPGETTLVSWPWKVVIRRVDQLQTALYDLRQDPGETRDVSEQSPGRFQKLRKRLVQAQRRPALAESQRRAPITKKQRDELRALGYL